jgi:hypothetical protein
MNCYKKVSWDNCPWKPEHLRSITKSSAPIPYVPQMTQAQTDAANRISINFAAQASHRFGPPGTIPSWVKKSNKP